MEEAFVNLLSVLCAGRVHIPEVSVHILDNQSNLLTLNSKVTEISSDDMVNRHMIPELLRHDCRGPPSLSGVWR